MTVSRSATVPKAPWLLLALAAAIRTFGCLVTPIPGRDGASYLWMAERWAGGDSQALFATVFHPLYPLLIGAIQWLAPGLDVVIAGQIASALPAAVAVVPLWFLTRRLFDERAATWAGLAYAIGNWFVQHPAECLSEGPFYLLTALWALLLLGSARRHGLACGLASGLAAGLAFLARPEGAVLIAIGVGHLLAVGSRRAALAHLGGGLCLLALQPIGSLAAGRGFTLTPKADFNWGIGAGRADSVLGHYGEQWLQLPGDAWEGIGYLVFPLAIAGAIRFRPRQLADPRLCLLLPLLAQCAVVPLVKSHHRFVSGFAILWLPFAGAAFAATLSWLRERHRTWPVFAVLLLLGSEARLLVDWPTDRTIERDLGRWLRRERSAEQTIASDMPRLVFFAGLQPPPPRRIPAADVLQLAATPECHFVVLKRGRTAIAPAALADLGYTARPLPATLATHPESGAIELYVR